MSTKAAPAITLQARKQQLVRTAIHDAAIDLFLRKGFDETTVDDIAEAAGVSRRSFFRYFASKSDLMAQGIVTYGSVITDAIEACPKDWLLPRVLRETVRKVVRDCAARPRTRDVMQIARTCPAARQAQLSRTAELQDRVAEAFARRTKSTDDDHITPVILAGLTISALGITFRSWFDQDEADIADIAATADRVIATIARLTRS